MTTIQESATMYETGLAERARTAFAPDRLASLPMNDYIEQLAQYPDQSDMIAHVVRHGIRDHNSGRHHDEGMGVYHIGAQQMLAGKHLRSFIHMAEDELFFDEPGTGSGKKLTGYIVEDSVSLDDARKEVQGTTYGVSMNRHLTSYYVDKKAVHFCVNRVDDRGYGAETGNEVFVAFPALMAAAHYKFQGLDTNVEDNDNWIWAGHRGVPIDAGVVFLPKSQPVDPSNGSRYQLNPDGKPIVDHELIRSVRNLTFDRQDPQLAEFFDTYRTAESRLDALADRPNEAQLLAEEFMADISRYYKSAENTVPAETYWQAHFAANPGSRPKHLVFYDGDPTEILKDWRETHGIVPAEPNPYYRNNHFGTGGTNYDEIFPENGFAAHKPEVREGQEFFYFLLLGAVRKELVKRS